eukprot:6482370-Amphidinium_carterae.1
MVDTCKDTIDRTHSYCRYVWNYGSVLLGSIGDMLQNFQDWHRDRTVYPQPGHRHIAPMVTMAPVLRNRTNR